MTSVVITVAVPSDTGAERMVHRYGRALVAAGHRVVVAHGPLPTDALGNAAPSIIPALQRDGMSTRLVTALAHRRGSAASRAVAAIGREFGARAVIGTQQRDAAVALAAAHRLGVCGIDFVQNHHHFWGNSIVRRAKRAVYRWVLSHRSHLVVCVSEAVQRDVVAEFRVATGRTIVIPNGIEVGRYTRNPLADRNHLFAELGVSADQLLMLTVGRLDHQKGHDVLVEAIVLLPSSVRDLVTFAFVGEATHGSNVKHVHEYESDLRNSVARHGYQQCVKFVGHRDDIVDLLSVADAFVQPSRWEGHSLALMEAMACGLPVITTHGAGRPEGFVDSTHGYVVPTADAVQLARAIEAVATIEPGERSAMGVRCAELASSQYDGARGAKEFVDAVETAIKENS